jgi:hypothetical protein
MMANRDDEPRPSLLEPQSRGGDIGEGGINFQAEVILSFIPKWLRMEGFTSMVREAMFDAEAKFFVPGRGHLVEAVEVKDHLVTPTKFWAEFERFKQVEAGSLGEYRWLTLASAGLSSELHPLVNSLRRVRDPYPFYEGSAVMENSYKEYVQRVTDMGRSEQDANLLFNKVLIDSDLNMARDAGLTLFKKSLNDNLPYHRNMPDWVLDEIYVGLSTFVRSRRNQPITRKELEGVLRERVPEQFRYFLPLISPVRIYTASSTEAEVDRTALRFEWQEFFGGNPPEYPPCPVWNERVLGELSIEMQYRGEAYATDMHPTQDTPQYSILTSFSPENLREGERLAVSIGILRNIAPDVEADLGRHGLSDTPHLHLQGTDPVVSPQQANLIVRRIKDRISEALARTRARRIDLFIAAPSYLALFLGHRLNATATVQCYERDKTGHYVPTCSLFV